MVFLGPTMNLIYSNADEIRSTSGDFKESKSLFSVPGITVSGLDIDTRRNLIYWTSSKYIFSIFNCINL